MNLNSVCRFKKTGPGHRVTERPTFSVYDKKIIIINKYNLFMTLLINFPKT
jgi:hypothetical protein